VNNPVFDFFIKIPEANEFNPITQTIPTQIPAYKLTALRGIDPDK
jgi:glucosamine 6-phosphate synthetase-like amidotransferase/phosphosugar isomerase protein